MIAVILAAVTTLGVVIKTLLKRIERHVNGIEDDIDHDHGPTLGQQVRTIAERQARHVADEERYWRSNDEAHEFIIGSLHATDRRLDRLENGPPPTRRGSRNPPAEPGAV